MIVLAADTSTPGGSIALRVHGGEILELTLGEDRPHSDTLLPVIEKALSDKGINRKDIDALAVGTGPGTFTGLRVGLATFKGWASAADIPVAPVVSLDAVALPVLDSGGSVLVAADARKGEVYAAFYQGLSLDGIPIRSGDVVLLSSDEFITWADGLPVEGCTVVGTGLALIEGTLDRVGKVTLDRSRSHPLASSILRIGEVVISRGDTVGPDELLPFYIRPPDAVPPSRNIIK